MSLLLLLALTACDPNAPERLPVAQAGPAEDFELIGATTAWLGQPALYQAVGVAPGATIYLIFGAPGGSSCPPQLSGTCLELGAPRLAVSARADAAGRVRWSWTPRVPAGSYGVEAAWFAGGVGHTSGAMRVSVVDPATTDSDSDGLLDEREFDEGTDPLSWDTDGDLLADGAEVRWLGTNPLLADTDSGGANDAAELAAETDPHNPDDDGSLYADADGDGVPDCDDHEECDGVDNDGDGLVDDGVGDADEDGVPDCFDTEVCDGLDNDGDEIIDEEQPDSDGDGLPDCRDAESCDGLDNDGDGRIDEGFDGDLDGLADCFEIERCDCRDDDLDGAIDEDCAYELSVRLTADDAYELAFDGYAWGAGAGWEDVDSYVGQVPSGVHHLAVHAWDVYAGAAGLLADVHINGQLVHVTGAPGWLASATLPAPGWQTAPVGMSAPQGVGFNWPGTHPQEANGADWIWAGDGLAPALWPEAWFVLELAVCGEYGVGQELCDGLDNDGDQAVDEGYPDDDVDGIANCIDADLRCDGLDNDGDGLVDEGFPDTDYDGIADCMDTETCDPYDNDGDGFLNEGQSDVDYDGVADCLDAEECDGLDNDGDGLADEGFSDIDGDLIADCIDRDPDCDGDDDDGDGLIDEGWSDKDRDGLPDCLDEETCDLIDNDGDGLVDDNIEGGCHVDPCATPDSRLWYVSSNKLTAWDADSNQIYSYTTLDRTVSDIAFGRDGLLYGTAGDDVFVIDLSTGATTLVGSAAPGTWGGRGLAAHPDGRLLTQRGSTTLAMDLDGNVTDYGGISQVHNRDSDLTWINRNLYALGHLKSHQPPGPDIAKLYGVSGGTAGPAVPLPRGVWVGAATLLDGRTFVVSDAVITPSQSRGVYQVDAPTQTVTWARDLLITTGLAALGDVCNGPIPPEVCNGVDDDGDGAVDEGFPDTDGDGICDELDREECDCLDNDGNGVVDEGCTHTVDVLAQADDRSRIYLDGVALDTTSGWTDWSMVSVTAQPGRHHFAAWATDNSGSAVGFRAAVRVDGVVVTATGDAGWLASTTLPGVGWPTNPSLFSSPWAEQGTCFGTWRVVNPLDSAGAAWIWTDSCLNVAETPESWFIVPFEVCGG